MLKGTGVCAGVGLGTALVVQTQELDWSGVQYAGAEQEKSRLAAAAKSVSDTLAAMAQAMTSQVGEHAAEILSGQIMMLADPFMIGQMNEQIEGGAVAEAAVDAVCGSFIAMFSAVEDELTRQRATDVADLRDRLLKTLLGREDQDLAAAPAGTVIVAHDLTPSMTVGLKRENIAGIITETGAPPATRPSWPGRWRSPRCSACPGRWRPSPPARRSPWTASWATSMWTRTSAR